MTVRQLIRQLVMYPMDAQVVDSCGSPIMYAVFHNRESDAVRLEPKSQIDVEDWLDNLFNDAIANGETDSDVFFGLKEQGFTMEDLKNYKDDVYNWAKHMAEELGEA